MIRLSARYDNFISSCTRSIGHSANNTGKDIERRLVFAHSKTFICKRQLRQDFSLTTNLIFGRYRQHRFRYRKPDFDFGRRVCFGSSLSHNQRGFSYSFDVNTAFGNNRNTLIGDCVGDLSPVVIGRYRRQGKRQIVIHLLSYLCHGKSRFTEITDRKSSRVIDKIIIGGFSSRDSDQERPGLDGLRYFTRNFGYGREDGFIFSRNKSLIDISQPGHFVALTALLVFGRYRQHRFRYRQGNCYFCRRMAVGRRLPHRKGRLAGSPDMYAPVCNDGHVFIGDRIGDLSPIVIGRYRRQGKR